MIVLHAFIKVDPSHRNQFLEQAQLIMKHSKAEEGNNSYHLYEDTIESNSFVMLEEWDDLAAIEYHNNTGHYKAFKDATAEMVLAPPRVERYDVAGKL
jgi:quinol monooxygenase YgiN